MWNLSEVQRHIYSPTENYSFSPLTILAKSSILNVQLGSPHVSRANNKDSKTMPSTSLLCLDCWLWTYLAHWFLCKYFSYVIHKFIYFCSFEQINLVKQVNVYLDCFIEKAILFSGLACWFLTPCLLLLKPEPLQISNLKG